MESRKTFCITFILLFILWLPSLRAYKAEADSLMFKAEQVMYTNPRQATYFAQKALESLPGETSGATRAQALLLLGRGYRYLGDFDISIKTLYDALHCCPPDNNKLLAEIQMQMADIYCRLKDYTKAFEINDKAATLCKIYQDSVGLATTYNTRGIIHYNLNEFKTAEQCFRNALQINRKIGNIKSVAANLNNMCLYEGDTNEKLSFINEAIIINKNLNATVALAENYNNMGKQYFFARQYVKALEALELAKVAAAAANGKELICDNYEYFSWVYAAMKQYNKSYECLVQLYHMSQELQNDKKLRNVEQEMSEKKLMDQQRENERAEQQYKIGLLQRNILILSVIVIFCIAVALFLPRWYRRRKNMQLIEARYRLEQSERELSELKVQQQALAIHSIQSELDTTRQEATGFAMFLRSRNELLERIREQIKEGYRMDASLLPAHLKKVNAFISQCQIGTEETNAILLSIEQKNSDFLKRLLVKHPTLTQGEKYLATLLRVNLSTKEISLLTGTTPKTINMNRYRLRKSLDLQSEDSLTEYLQII